MDEKGYTASFLCVSGAFYDPRSSTTGPCASQPASHSPYTNYRRHPRLLAAMLMQWQIDPQKILFVVTDNGSNMVKAVRILSAAFQSKMSESAIEKDTDDEDIEQDEKENAVDDTDDYNITFHRFRTFHTQCN